LEKRRPLLTASFVRMLNAITHSQIYVLDQDEALEFYVGRLGLELHTDADLGFMRWLTVNVPGRPDREIFLAKPGPPVHDEATAEQVRELVTKGAMGLSAILTTDDVRSDHETLAGRGVEHTEEPTERFYGTDCGFRDPFGNQLRLAQPTPGPIEVPDPSELAEDAPTRPE
jgi:catechol 2,3-dioxygenase-like lactoylglutathione lyase family enzyme